MNFLDRIKNSIYSPKFYASISQSKFSSAISYFLLLAILLTIFQGLAVIKPILMELPAEIKKGVEDIGTCYPNDLVVQITNGIATTNVTEPYIFSGCEEKQETPIIVIDTKTPYSAEKFKEYNSLAWLTNDSLFYQKNDYEVSSYSLAEIKDFKLDKNFVTTKISEFSPYLNFVGPILFIFSLFGIYIAYSIRLIYLLIFSVFLIVLGKLFGKNLTYPNAYKMGLYALTLGLLVEIIVNLTSPYTRFNGFPFMFSFIFFGVVIVNYFTTKKS